MTRTGLKLFVALLVVMAGVAGGVAPGVAAAGPTAQDAECEFPATFEDAGGAEVTLEEEPEEVVTLNPSAAQTMWEIGAEDKVTGVSQYASYLDGAENRTVVSAEDGFGTSVETVIDLDPDLVLAPNTIPPETVDQLREEGDLTVYHFESAGSIDDVRDKTHLIGQMVGECEGAEETVSWMDEELSNVEEAIEGEDRPPVYLEFHAFTAGSNTFQDEVLTTAGGENVAAEAGIEGWGEMSQEQLVEQNPEWLILPEGAPMPEGEGIESSTAMQEGQIIEVTEEHMQQPAPRVVYAVIEITQEVHSEAYAEATAADETDDETTDESADDETTDDGADDETTDDGADGETTDDGADGETTDNGADDDESTDPVPGFGIAAALTALLAVVALRRR